MTKKILKILLTIMVLGVSSANAFDSGKYTCHFHLYNLKLNLKSNGRYILITKSLGQSAENRGNWKNDGDAAIILTESVVNGRNVIKKSILERDKGGSGFTYLGAIPCDKEGAAKTKVTFIKYDISPTADQYNKTLDKVRKTKDMSSVYQLCEVYPSYDIFHIFASVARMDATAINKEKKKLGKKKWEATVNMFKDAVKTLNFPEYKVDGLCKERVRTIKGFSEGQGISISNGAVTKCQSICVKRVLKSLRFARNINNYKIFN